MSLNAVVTAVHVNGLGVHIPVARWSRRCHRGHKMGNEGAGEVTSQQRVVGHSEWGNGTSAGGYNGMLPCFFGGLESRLFFSMAKAVISFRRVKRGSMISSM